ncbi:MAG: class I SAM-dependent methyltransferase [Gammaproteobacteria bacterium]|nr:class I SAM-dependent methyltransferase [Gammaproteobacteria bacterium]MYD01982.1 class I SAM-dependent methyltransferase [Gammaproteobacteria bacterium]MYI26447.1 class I SAM-dependent methyltransferase [Gammaproteobacteria bacterium]
MVMFEAEGVRQETMRSDVYPRHGMMAGATHDELAAQKYFLGLRAYANGRLMAQAIDACNEKIMPEMGECDPEDEEDRDAVLRKSEELPIFQHWGALLRTSQELMWDYVADTVDRQLDDLEDKFRSIDEPLGSLTLHPDVPNPEYLTLVDQHIQPGGYLHDAGGDDVRAGAIYDRGAVLYGLGRAGGLNDVRGHTLCAFIQDAFPDEQPKRILDLGCGVGHGTLALVDLYPDAELHAIDIGGALLRYAHARAESLGKRVHFHQQDARNLKFEDESFDMVTSEILFHETSRRAMPAILKEACRVLKPGGAMCNLEVPLRYKGMDMGGVVVRDWQNYYNAEPFWGSLGCVDFEQAMKDAGFTRIVQGFQPRTLNFAGERGTMDKEDPSMGALSHWVVFGGYKD